MGLTLDRNNQKQPNISCLKGSPFSTLTPNYPNFHINYDKYVSLGILRNCNMHSLEQIQKELTDIINKNPSTPTNKFANSRYDKEIDILTLPNINELLKVTDNHNHFDEYIYSTSYNYVKDCFGDPNKLLSYYNSWLKAAVNAMQLHYYKVYGSIPGSIISIPEHLAHKVFLSKTKKELLDNIEFVLNKYNGGTKIYSNCYAKELQKTFNKLAECKRSPLTKTPKPSDLLIDHSNKNAKINYTVTDPSKETIDGICKRKLGEKCAKYLMNLEDMELNVVIDQINKAGYSPKTNTIFLNFNSQSRSYAHETVHSKEEDGSYYTQTDFIGEHTKGSIKESLKKVADCFDECEQNKPPTSNLNYPNPYISKTCSTWEDYGHSELLSTILGSLVPKIDGDFEQVVNYKKKIFINSGCKISQDEIIDMVVDDMFIRCKQHIKIKFDELYENYPELAALVLAFNRDDLNHKKRNKRMML